MMKRNIAAAIAHFRLPRWPFRRIPARASEAAGAATFGDSGRRARGSAARLLSARGLTRPRPYAAGLPSSAPAATRGATFLPDARRALLPAATRCSRRRTGSPAPGYSPPDPYLPLRSRGRPAEWPASSRSFGQVNSTTDPFNLQGLSTPFMFVPWTLRFRDGPTRNMELVAGTRGRSATLFGRTAFAARKA